MTDWLNVGLMRLTLRVLDNEDNHLNVTYVTRIFEGFIT